MAKNNKTRLVKDYDKLPLEIQGHYHRRIIKNLCI